MDNDNGSNAGGSDPNAGAGDPGQGNQPGGNPNDGGQNNGADPGNQNGQQTDPRDAELAKQKAEIQRLNRALVQQNRRSSSQTRQPGNQGGEGQSNPFETPEGQYGIALQLATNELRGRMEGIFTHYPEIPAGEISRIRMNPWAFASHEAFISGDWQRALEDIEYALLDRVDELAADPNNKGGQNGQQNGTGNSNGQGGKKTVPAQVNNNPNNVPDTDALPGSPEDENPWTMPMDKLEKKAFTEIRRKQTAK